MRFTKIKKAVAMLLLFALLFSTFPMSALANDTDEPEETAVTEETATVETETGVPPEETETDAIQSETGQIKVEVATDDNGEAVLALNPGADLRAYHDAYMDHRARFFFKDGNVDSIKRMIYNGKTYVGFCLHRTLNSGHHWDYSYNQDNWYLDGDVTSKKEAIGKIIAIANRLDENVMYTWGEDQSLTTARKMTKELAIQLLIWEIAEKTTNGPYALGNQFRYKLNDESRGIQYIGFPDAAFTTWGNEYYVASELQIDSAVAYYDQIAQEYNKTLNPPALPSFAGPASNTYDPYEMTYNSATGKYTLTMQDTNNVLSHYTPHCSNSNVTVATSGNTITVTATNPDSFNNAVIELEGDTYDYTFKKEYYLAFVPDDTSTSQVCLGWEPYWTPKKYGYFRIKAETKKPVTIKKETDTTGGSNVAACIQGNNMYSLAGAQFKITASGYSDKIVTTGADGTVVINDTYNVGTVITVQEIKAPPGYILNSQSKQFTVTADGTNVFVMKDKPVFDPNHLVLTKTGNNNERIAGAVFKVEYFDNATHSGSPTRTWYFESKSDGYVEFSDDYLASGYTSSDLFKPYGDAQGPMFPLGSVKVTEIKAAPNYILPSGAAASAYIYIEQSEDTLSAKARWGDSNGNTVTTLGIYKFTNDGVNAVNDEYGHMTMKKTLPADTPGGLEGYGFNIFCGANGVTWHGRTDANGNIYQTNASHAAVAEGSRNYTFDGLVDGTYAFRELLSEREVQDTRTEQVTFTVYRKGSAEIVCQKTYSGTSLSWDTNGDCIIGGVELTGLSSGGTLAIEITNVPKPGYIVLSKTLPDDAPGSIEGYCFNIHRRAGEGFSAETWRGRTDQNGNIYKTNSSYAENTSPSDADYQFTGLYDGYYDFRELLSMREYKNTKTTKVTFTVTDLNGTQVMQRSYSGSSLSWQDNGDCVISNVHVTGLNGGGTLSIEIENAPIPGTPPTLVKKDASTDLPLEGAIFLVEYYSAETVTGSDIVRSWFLRSDADGYVALDAAHLVNTSAYQSDDLYDTGKLPIGCMRIEEVEAPEGFKKSDSIGYWYMKLTNPKTFAVSTYWGDEAGNATDDYGDDAYVIDNELYVENMPSNTLTIRKTSSNGRIKGITFEVRQYVTGHGWLPLGDGTYVTGDGGKIEIPDLAAGTRVQIKEIVQEGSICLSQNPQEITLQIGDNPVNFENVDISLKIKKECSDGKIDGITFKVEKKVNGSWTLIGSYVTGTDGIIPIATEHLAIGAEFRITETAPQNYVCVNTPDGVQTVTLHAGENVVTFINKPVIKLELYKTSDDGNIKDIEFKLYKQNKSGIFEYVGTYLTDANGYICDEEVLKEGETYKIVETVPTDSFCEKPVKTFTAHLGTNTVRFENFGIVTLEIIKRTSSADGIVDGFKFKIERLAQQTESGVVGRERWETIGTYVSANGGHIYIDDPGLLRIGDEIRIEEIDLGDYVCTTENPIRRTLVKGENVFEFTNRFDTELLIQKESDDGKIKGITFVVERKKAEGEYSLLGEFETDENGQIHIENIEKDQTYKITETLPYGYETDHVSQEITIRAGTNKVTFVNRLIECSIKIGKVYEGTRVPLKDAGFKLYDERGEELAEGFTNENGELKFERLRVGNYTLKEFQAPPGFELDETEIPITLTPDERDITITRENKIIPGLIRVYKEDDKGRAMKGVTYLLEYSLDDTDTWLPIQVRDADSPVQCGYSTSANIVDGCITTGDDGIAEFAGLAIDNAMHTIKYRLTEVGTQDGYDLLPEPVFEGHLTEEQVELAYKVVNHHVFEMPITGGNGFTLAAIGSALAVLLAVIILLRLPKKKEDDNQ